MGKVSSCKKARGKTKRIMLDSVTFNRGIVDSELQVAIIAALKDEIRAFGSASLLVSGGSTPKRLFDLLSNEKLEWDKVTLSLVDERFLPNGHTDQNGELIKEHLLKNEAIKANFIPLVFDPADAENNLNMAVKAFENVSRPFTVVVLGMGTDGHTASLFPDSPMLDRAMDKNSSEILLNVTTPSSPYSRITFSRKVLLDAKNLFLHYYGAEKKEILASVLDCTNQNKYPISGFVNQKENVLKVYWAM